MAEVHAANDVTMLVDERQKDVVVIGVEPVVEAMLLEQPGWYMRN